MPERDKNSPYLSTIPVLPEWSLPVLIDFRNCFICFLKCVILVHEIIDTSDGARKHFKIGKCWIERDGIRFGSFSQTLAVTIYSISIPVRPTLGDATTTNMEKQVKIKLKKLHLWSRQILLKVNWKILILRKPLKARSIRVSLLFLPTSE